MLGFVSVVISQFCDLSVLRFVSFAICQFDDLSVWRFVTFANNFFSPYIQAALEPCPVFVSYHG